MQTRNIVAKKRRVVMEDKPNKKASADDISKLISRAQTHHHGDDQLNLSELGNKMVASGSAGEAFDNVAMQIDNIEDLLGAADAEHQKLKEEAEEVGAAESGARKEDMTGEHREKSEQAPKHVRQRSKHKCHQQIPDQEG